MNEMAWIDTHQHEPFSDCRNVACPAFAVPVTSQAGDRHHSTAETSCTMTPDTDQLSYRSNTTYLGDDIETRSSHSHSSLPFSSPDVYPDADDGKPILQCRVDPKGCTTSDSGQDRSTLINQRLYLNSDIDTTTLLDNGGICRQRAMDGLLSHLVAFGQQQDDDTSSILVLLLFYRKFIKPGELAQWLVYRFEHDDPSLSGEQPTPLQQRIHSILVTWLTQFWSDFYSPEPQIVVGQFAHRLCLCETLGPMGRVLQSLIDRSLPTNDPDTTWARSDTIRMHADQLSLLSDPSFAREDAGCGGSLYEHQRAQRPRPRLTPLSLTPSHHSLRGAMDRDTRRLRSRRSFATPLSPKSLRLFTSWRGKKPAQPVTASMVSSSLSLEPAELLPTASSCVTEFSSSSPDTPLLQSPPVHIDTSSISPTGKSPPGPRSPSPSKFPLSSEHWLFRWDGRRVAEQLTWTEAQLLLHVEPRDLVRALWNSSHADPSNDIARPRRLASCIAHFNFVSAWVTTTIVSQPKLAIRVALFERLIKIAVELRRLNNYNLVMAFLAGINSAAVLRLKQTRQQLQDKPIFDQLQNLEELMSSERSFATYRLVLKTCGAPCIPYLGIHNQDLVSLDEANKDFKTDGSIHWDKFRLMGTTILSITKDCRPSEYAIQPDRTLLQLLSESVILAEDEQYRQSIVVEPVTKNPYALRFSNFLRKRLL